MVVHQHIDRMGLVRGAAPIRPISVHHLAGYQSVPGERHARADSHAPTPPLPSRSVLPCRISTRSPCRASRSDPRPRGRAWSGPRFLAVATWRIFHSASITSRDELIGPIRGSRREGCVAGRVGRSEGVHRVSDRRAKTEPHQARFESLRRRRARQVHPHHRFSAAHGHATPEEAMSGRVFGYLRRSRRARRKAQPRHRPQDHRRPPRSCACSPCAGGWWSSAA